MDLETAVSVLKQELKDHPEKLEIEKQTIEKYGKLFSFNNIDNLTVEQFHEFCDIKNNHHWTISRHKTNLTKDMSKLRQSLKILLDESIPIANRLKRLRDNKNPDYQPFLGEAYFSPILLVTHPDKYPVYNGTVKDALNKMRLSKTSSRHIWDRYPEIQTIVSGMAQSHDLTLWQMDWVWWKALGAKSFRDLLSFIRDEMVMYENYQPVVLRKLLLSGSATREEIEEELREHNPDSESKSMTNTVLQVLQNEKHPIIRKQDDEYVINSFEELTSHKINELVNLCDKRISQFKKEIAICWPTDKGDEKITEFENFISQNGKILWGVNWGASKVRQEDYPIQGYVYHRQEIIAIAKITNITEHENTSESDHRLRPTGLGYSENYSHYLHISELEPCKPFSHLRLEMWDEGKQMPQIVQQRVYVKKKTDFAKPNYWIWSVTPENWEIIKEKNIWASRIGQKIRDKIRPGDKVIFYVQRTHEFQGIFKFIGEWYDAPEPVWSDETDSVIYQSQIKLLPIILGNVNVYESAPQLKMFPNPNDKRRINLVLKGGGGYSSNNGKPIVYQDYKRLLELMNESKNIGNYYIITQNEGSGYDDIPGVQYAFDSDKANYKNFVEGTNFIVQSKINNQNFFVGFGKVKDITMHGPRTKENGRQVTDIIAKFSEYQDFPEKKNRTNAINEKMLNIAFPSGVRNIPPAMLPIPKELYDEIVHNIEKPSGPPEKLFEDKQIAPPSPEEMQRGFNEIKEYLLIPDKKIREIINALSSGSHVILAGPIGTGKTELARTIPKLFWSTEGGYYSDIYTATADWNTQDVIGGIVPKMKNDQVIYKIQDGCVTESVRKNWIGEKRASKTIDGHAYSGVWATIDEFNRADIDKAFGQLFTALRTRQMKIPTDSINRTTDSLKIPKDFRIIGTLNTSDKHYLFPLSDALKSRFALIEIDVPDKKFKDNEVFYAFRNAADSLEIVNYNQLTLDVQNKIIQPGENQQLFSKIYEAYNILDFVRQFHKLGTAILKIIYQNLLSGNNSQFDLNESLDNSINSVIIPQLEKLSEMELGCINAIINNNLVGYFKEINRTNKRYNASKTFSRVMNYLNLESKDYNYFTERELKDDDKLWKDIEDEISKLISDKEKLPSNLHQTSSSLESLMEQSVI